MVLKLTFTLTLNLIPYTLYHFVPSTLYLALFNAKIATIYIITPPTAITGIPKLIAAWAATMALSTDAHPFTDQAYAR